MQVEAPAPVWSSLPKEGKSVEIVSPQKKVEHAALDKPILITKLMEQQIKNMFIPPPIDLMAKQYDNNEPVRSGFNQSFLPIRIKDNIEHGHYSQGP